MTEHEEFLAKAIKVIEYHDKLIQLKEGGEVDEDTYKLKWEKLVNHVDKLKQMHLNLLTYEMSDININLANSETEKLEGEIDTIGYDNKISGFKKEGDDIRTERGMIEMSDQSDYIKKLKSIIKTKKFEKRESVMEELEEPVKKKMSIAARRAEIPLWAKLIFITYLVILTIVTMYHVGPSNAVIVIAAILVEIGLRSLFLHSSTAVLKFKLTSINRGFTCIMMVVAIGIITKIALSIILTLTLSRSYIAESVMTVVSIAPTILLGMVIPFFCIQKIFEVSKQDSIKATIIYFILYLVLEIILKVIFGLIGVMNIMMFSGIPQELLI